MTNTFKPKEPPKRCGSCANIMRLSPSEFSKEEACYVCYHMREVADGGYPVFPLVCFDDQACEKWKPRTDILQQRHEQLKQVAKEMLGRFNALRKLDNEAFDKIAKADIEDDCLIFSEKLEALGVDIR